MMTKIIKWNLAFIILYALSSTLVYFISQDTPETIPVIVLTCLIFNGLITIWILYTHLNKPVQTFSERQEFLSSIEDRSKDVLDSDGQGIPERAQEPPRSHERRSYRQSINRRFLTKQEGGEENEKTEQGSTDEIAANPELPGNSDDTNDVY